MRILIKFQEQYEASKYYIFAFLMLSEYHINRFWHCVACNLKCRYFIAFDIELKHQFPALKTLEPT